MSLPIYRYGSLPGETVGTYAHISKGEWWLLRHDPGFLENWNSSMIDRPYHIAVSCLTRGLSTEQLLTVLKIWHQKHGHTFYEDDFMQWTYPAAADYAAPFVFRHEANKYWDEIRRIESDPKARQHSKLRVAYYLMNTEQATASEIHQKTGIPRKTVRNSLATLQADGKVVMTTFGVYRAVRSFHWDRATLVGGIDDGYVFDDDHPAMHSWGQTINESELGDDGCWRMRCYDYCRDEFGVVVFDGGQQFLNDVSNPGECEWVIREDREVVENGTGVRFLSVFAQFGQWDVVTHKNGNNLDFRSGNLIVAGKEVRPGVLDENVDFYSRLCA
jgi:hypothetical protein